MFNDDLTYTEIFIDPDDDRPVTFVEGEHGEIITLYNGTFHCLLVM